MDSDSMTSLARALIEEVWQAVLPQRCIVCGEWGAALHDACLDALPAATGSRCDHCWRPLDAREVRAEVGRCERCAGGTTPVFEALRTPFRFEGYARRAILEAKFRGVTAHLGPLGRAAAGVVPATWGVEAVVPVPLSARRERPRGFNQAREAGRTFAETLGVPLADGLVRRVRETAPQASLDAEARARNLSGAFLVPPGTRVPPRVVVVDDVTTTGATLAAVAAALLDGGAEHVFALAIARED